MSDKKPWEQFANAQPQDTEQKPWESFSSQTKPKEAERKALSDIGNSIASGAAAAGRGILGLSDLVTGSNSIQNTKNLGLDIKSSEQAWKDNLSEKAKQEEQAWNNTQGFVDTLKYGATHPFAVANKVAESLPAMAVSGGMGGAVTKGVIGGAIGEGMQQAGSSYADAIEKNNGNTPTDKDAGAALGSGITTGTISALSGGLAKKLGIGDIDTAIANRVAGEAATSARPLGLGAYAKNIGEGIITEGALEELPQSATEQMWQNYADGNPIMEGVPEAAAQGLITGGLMGGAFNAANLPTFDKSQSQQNDTTNATPYSQSGVAEVIDPNTPQLEYTPPQPPQGIPYAPVSDTFNVSPDGVVFGDENINEYLQGKQAQDEAMRKAGMPSDINDITPVPTDAKGFNTDILNALPAPTNNFTVDGNGNVLTTTDLNSQLEEQRQADIERRNRIASGLPNDATAIPQEAVGFGVENNITPALPYKNDIMVDSQGNAYAGDQINEPLQSERQQNIENLANSLQSKGVNDVTPVPSEAQGFINDTRTPAEKIGLDPNQGGLSSAAAIAVDTGASPITAELQRQATQSQPNEQANWLNGIASPTAQSQNEAPQLGYSPSENTNTDTPPAQQAQVADLWNSQEPQQRMAILGGIYGNEDMARQNALASFDRLPKPVQQQIADIAVQNGAVSEDSNTQSSNGQTTQTAPQAPLTTLAQDIAPTSQANAAPAIEPILGKDGKNKWFATQNKADEFIQKKSLGDNYTIEQTGKMRYEIVPKAQEQAPTQEPQRTQQAYSLPSKTKKSWTGDTEIDVSGDWQSVRENGKPDERQQMVINATQKALDEGLYSNEKITNRVAEILDVPKDILQQNTDRVEGGYFGSDVYAARQYIGRQKRDDANNQSKQKLNLQTGQSIGTLVTDTGKTLKNAIVEKADDSQISVIATVGNKKSRFTVNYTDVDNAISRAVKDGKRQPFKEPKLYGKESYIQTGSERQPTRVAVVEADSLAPDDKNTDNQFRDRTRSASQMQIDSIANNLDPRQLADSTTMATGSPTLANDGKTIIAGNGRTKAIKQAYAQGKGAEYKQSLIEQAQSLGIDPQQIAGMKNPVLVKEFANPVDVKKMAIESNATGGLAMSAKEQARADSALMPDMSMLASDDKGNINLSRNAHIFRKFISSLPVEAQASMLDKDGLLSKEGLARLQNAVLYKAYGDSKAFDDMVENTDVDVKNAINGLTQVATKIAQTKESINQGMSYDADISDDITAALSLLQQIRKNEMSVSDYLSQMGLFDDGLSPVAKEFIQYIDDNIRSAKAIADLLSTYYDNLDALGNPNQQDLLGGKPNTDKQSLFKQALEQVRNAKQPKQTTNDLFSEPTASDTGQSATQADKAVEQRPNQSEGDGTSVGSNESARPSDEQVKTALKELVSDDVWSGKKALIISPSFVQKVADQLGYQGDIQNKADGTMSDFAKQVNDVYGGMIKNQANPSNQKAKGTPQPSKYQQFQSSIVSDDTFENTQQQTNGAKEIKFESNKNYQFEYDVNAALDADGFNQEGDFLRLDYKNKNQPLSAAKAYGARVFFSYNQTTGKVSSIVSVYTDSTHKRSIEITNEPNNQYPKVKFETEFYKPLFDVVAKDERAFQDYIDSGKWQAEKDAKREQIKQNFIDNKPAIFTDLAKKYMSASLVDLAGVETAEQFRGLSDESQAEAFAKLVEQTGYVPPKKKSNPTSAKESIAKAQTKKKLSNSPINHPSTKEFFSIKRNTLLVAADDVIAEINNLHKKAKDAGHNPKSFDTWFNDSVANSEKFASNNIELFGLYNDAKRRMAKYLKAEKDARNANFRQDRDLIDAYDFLEKDGFKYHFRNLVNYGNYLESLVKSQSISADDNTQAKPTNVKEGIAKTRAKKQTAKAKPSEPKYSQMGAGQPKENRDDQGRLLAPNGMPSNLTEQQWSQVRTKEFKDWFGDWENDAVNASKVVDDNGEPLVVYHGTKSEFTVFDIKKAGVSDSGVVGKAFYFTPFKSQADNIANSSMYGKGNGNNTISTFINLKNPAIIQDGTFPDGRSLMDIHQNGLTKKSSDAINKDLKKQGHDGVIFKSGKLIEQMASFSPNQIKSATNNNGAFDPNNNDIRYSQTGEYTPDLIVTHNLTADAIIHADKIGGLPFASIAITKQDNPLTGFGEVTLIGDKNLIDPKGVNKAKVFGSDIYSPRYPRVVVKADSKKLAQFNKDLEPARQVIESSQQISEEDFAGKYNVLNDNLVKLHFLQQNGVNIERKYREVEEEVSGNKDQIDSAKADVKSLEQFADAFGVNNVEQYLAQATDSEIYAKVQEIGENNPDAFDAIFKTLADAKVERSPFKTRVRMLMDNIRMSRGKTGNYLIGSLQSMAGVVSGRTQLVEDGVRKKQVFDYSDTINQIDKALTDNNLEQAFNDYIDNVRSDLVIDERLDNGVTSTGARRTVAHTIENVVKKLKKDLRGGESFNYGLPSVRAKVTPQFKTVQQIQESKDKIITSEQFDPIKKEIDDEMSDLSDKLGLESYLDIGDFLADVIDNGADKAFDFFNVKNSVPNKKLVADFLAKLKDMPTTYFEVKAKEVTQFSDFTGAVVPNSISHKARNILEQAGLKLYTYGSNVGIERADAIKQATTELNNANGNILFSQTNDTESKLRSELQSLMAMQKQASQGLSLTERANNKQLREIIRRIDETKSELQKVLDKKSQPMQSNSGKENLIVSEYTGSRTVYHGTKAAVADEIMQNGIKFGSQLNDGDYRGGGYGVIQNSTSASLDPNVSKNFSNDAKPSIVKIQLADDAKIITIENEMYAEDLEDYADELKGVDAVYLANNGEQEIVILNKDKVKVVESRGFSIRDAIPRFSVLNQEQGQVQSQAPSNPTNRTKSNQTAVQNITKTLSDKFGKAAIDKLIADGNLEIIDYAEAKRRNPKTPSNADGYYADGKAVLIADNLSPDMIIPTFLHELGGHGGLQTLMSDKAYQSLMKEFDRMVLEGNQLAKDAKAFADATSPNAKVAQDEYLPYLISLAAKVQGNSKVKSMLNRIVMAVKSFMRDKFGASFKITPADIVALAEKMVSERAMQSNVTASMPAQYSKQTPQTEIDQVRQQYEGTSQWMKSPNGKPTNLTEQQWLQVRTPSFKAWFGDWENDAVNASKVVDENGEPTVIYHGTTKSINTFNTKDFGALLGKGSYFTTDKAEAAQYSQDSNIIASFINIKNPRYANSVMDNIPSQAEMAAQGFDGVILNDDNKVKWAIAHEPNQIKSATNNNGAFDSNNNDIRYSQMGGSSPQVNALSKALSDFLKNPLSFAKTVADNKYTDNLGKALALLGRRQLVDIYQKDLPPIKEYSDIVEQMDADSNEKAYEADKLVKEWGKLKDELPLAELMHDATLKGIDPAEAYQTGDDRAIYQQLRRRYDALSPDAKRIYKQARDDYKAQQRSVFEAIKGRIQRTDMSAPRQAELIRKMEQGFFFGQKVYFPLARFGNYVVAVKDAAGDIISVSRAETKGQADELRKELIAQYPNDKVGRVMLDKEFVSSRDGVTRGFMSDLFEAVDKLNISSQERAEFEDTLGQLYLNSLPDISFAKSGMHRKGTPGFSQNARRAYAQHMSRGSHYIAKMRHSDVLQAKLDEMQEYVKAQGEVDPNYDQPKMQRVVDEMEKRHESLMNNHTAGWSSLATSVGFMWYMGLSPASALVNLSQTALVAYPVMGAKWGFAKASKELLIASGQASKSLNNLQSSLSGDEKTAFDEAVKRGVIDMTQAHDLAGVARGEDDSVMWKIRKPMEWASFMFHHAEKFNRQVTFVASYRLAKQAGANHKQAIEQAIDATYEGHFSYASSNRPRIMQGDWARVFLLFKQYGQNMVYTLSRNAYLSAKGDKQAMKTLAGMLALHGTFAGILGLPLVSTLLSAASMLGGDDDEPWDAEIALRNYLAELLGDDASEVISKGLPRALGMDLSSRVGLDSLILPRMQEGLEGQRAGESFTAAMTGPVAGIGVNAIAGFSDIQKAVTPNEYLIGTEKLLPKAFRDLMKTYRLAAYGNVDKTGIEIVPQENISLSDVGQQALGFRSGKIAQAQEGKSAIYKMDKEIGSKRQRLMNRYAKAYMAGDVVAADEAWQDIKRFNAGVGKDYPKLKITKPKLMQSIKQRRRRIDDAEDGIYLPSSREASRQYGSFATE